MYMIALIYIQTKPQRNIKQISINPVALRKAKIGLSECNKINANLPYFYK